MSDQDFVVLSEEVCRRALAALAAIEAWYQSDEACTTDEELFDSGRDLFHAMRPGLAVLRRARGLPPEEPCTACGTEEGGASSGPLDPEHPEAGRFSLCAACAQKRDDARPRFVEVDPRSNVLPFRISAAQASPWREV